MLVQEVQNSSAAVMAYQAPVIQRPTEKPHGSILTVQGVIHGVQCSYLSLIELQVEAAKGTVKLYNDNYYQMEFSAANFTPQGNIHPCNDLEGAKAKLQYFATADKTADGQIIGIELSK
jgi:hypothetical protein